MGIPNFINEFEKNTFFIMSTCVGLNLFWAQKYRCFNQFRIKNCSILSYEILNGQILIMKCI